MTGQTNAQIVSGGGEHIYSGTEQKIGKWIDGKDLYEITLSGTTVSGSQSDYEWTSITSQLTTLGITIDTLVNISGWIDSTPAVPLNCYLTGNYQNAPYWKDGTLWLQAYANVRNKSCVVTLQYTKVTS